MACLHIRARRKSDVAEIYRTVWGHRRSLGKEGPVKKHFQLSTFSNNRRVTRRRHILSGNGARH